MNDLYEIIEPIQWPVNYWVLLLFVLFIQHGSKNLPLCQDSAHLCWSHGIILRQLPL